VFLLENGLSAIFDNSGAHIFDEKITHGDIMIDGIGVGDVGSQVIDDREKLSQGVVILAVTVSKSAHKIIAGPDVQIRGLVFIKDSDAILRDVSKIFLTTMQDELSGETYNIDKIRDDVYDKCLRAIRRQTGKEPMVLPLIIEVVKGFFSNSERAFYKNVLSSLLLLANQALLWTLAIVFLIAGVVLLFFPFWKKTTLFLIRFFKAHHAKRAAQKETERLKQEALNQATLEEQNAPLEGDYSPLSRSNGPLPLNDAPVASPVTAIPAPKEEEEEASLSRSELYGEHRASPLPTAVEPTPEQLNHPFVSPNELVHSGLQEAVFTPDGEPAYSPNPTPSFSSPSQPAPAFESGIHSNEIKTSDEEETPESNSAPVEAAPKSNEIVPPTSVAAPSPVNAPKEAVKPEPYVAPA
jgi:hypothetical protein